VRGAGGVARSCSTFFDVEFDGDGNAPTPTHKSPSAALPVSFDPNPKPDPELTSSMDANIAQPLAVTHLQKDDVILLTVPSNASMADVDEVSSKLKERFEGYPVRVAVITQNIGLSVIRQPQA